MSVQADLISPASVLKMSAAALQAQQALPADLVVPSCL